MSGSTLIQEQDIDPGVGFAKESTAQEILAKIAEMIAKEGLTGDTGGTATAGTMMAKLNAIISGLSSAGGGLSIKTGSVTAALDTSDYNYKATLPSGVGWYGHENQQESYIKTRKASLKVNLSSNFGNAPTVYYALFNI